MRACSLLFVINANASLSGVPTNGQFDVSRLPPIIAERETSVRANMARLVTFEVPLTSSLTLGDVVPIPTLPELSTVKRVLEFVDIASSFVADKNMPLVGALAVAVNARA